MSVGSGNTDVVGSNINMEDNKEEDDIGIDGWTLIDEEKEERLKYDLSHPWWQLNDDYQWESLSNKYKQHVQSKSKRKYAKPFLVGDDVIELEDTTFTCGIIYLGIKNVNADLTQVAQFNKMPIICAEPENNDTIHDLPVKREDDK